MKLSLAFVTIALLFASVQSISMKTMLNRQEATSKCGPDPCHSFDSSVTTSAGAEMVRIPISVAVDTSDPSQLSTYAPTTSSSQSPYLSSSQSPYQSFSQSSASASQSAIGYPTPKPFRKAPPASPAAVAAVLTGIAKMANTVPKGVTITTTSNIGAQMFTTTITHHDDPKAPVIGASAPPPPAPSANALSGSSDISDLPSFFPNDMSSMVSNPSSSSSSSSLSPPSLDSIKLPQPPAAVAPLPSESSSSSSSIPPIPASGAPVSGEGDDECASGACSRRGKIKINSNVEISIGKKKSQQEKEASESSLSDESSAADPKVPSAGSSAGAPPVTALQNK